MVWRQDFKTRLRGGEQVLAVYQGVHLIEDEAATKHHSYTEMNTG